VITYTKINVVYNNSKESDLHVLILIAAMLLGTTNSLSIKGIKESTILHRRTTSFSSISLLFSRFSDAKTM